MTAPLYEEDFIEMLGRGDNPEEIARYAGVSVAAIERRFYRLAKQVQNEIIEIRGGRPFHWWQQRQRMDYRCVGRPRNRKKKMI